MLDRPATCKDLRDENTEEANERIENLMELVSAAREYETREAEASLGGFVDRLSLLSEADEESGTREARVWLMTMHAAKGLEFPVVIIAGLEEGLFPHSRSGEDDEELEEERRLCYVGMTRARAQPGADQRRAPPRVRRVSVDRAVAVPRRDSGGAGRAHRAGVPSSSYQGGFATATTSSGPTRTAAKGRAARCARQSRPTPTRTRISRPATFGPGMRVRHAQFGVGNVIAVEEHNDDIKVTVRFNTVGREEAAREVRQAGTGVAVAPARRRTASRYSSARARPCRRRLAGRARHRGLVARLGDHVAAPFGPCALVAFLLGQPRDRDDLVAFFHLDQPHALRGAADRADVARRHPQDHALLGDQHQLVVVVHVGDADDLAVALAWSGC